VIPATSPTTTTISLKITQTTTNKQLELNCNSLRLRQGAAFLLEILIMPRTLKPLPLLGSLGMKDAYSRDFEARRKLTHPGQAHLVDLDSNRRCSECCYHDPASRSKAARRCVLATQLRHAKGLPIPSNWRACTRFVEKRLPAPKSEFTLRRERFLDPDSWRVSSRNPNNRVRSIIGTDMIVCLYLDRHHPGRWSWSINHDDGGQTIFSDHAFDSLDEARLDVWEHEIAPLTIDRQIDWLTPDPTES
jgi:hypothetical protein